jgi:hypothetical protein
MTMIGVSRAYQKLRVPFLKPSYFLKKGGIGYGLTLFIFYFQTSHSLFLTSRPFLASERASLKRSPKTNTSDISWIGFIATNLLANN